MPKSQHKTLGPRLWDIKTPWTLLMDPEKAGAENLERLVSVYIDPVYAFYRAQGLSAVDAEDLTQSVLLDFFIVRKSHTQVERAQGRFRNFLLASARHGLINWKKHKQAQRRGGGKAGFSLDQLSAEGVRWEPAGGESPDEEYERQWALATWKAALEQFRAKGEARLIEAFDLFYFGPGKISQQEAAEKLGTSVAAFNSRMHNARRRVFECVREIVRVTVESEEELNEELNRIREHLNRCGI